MCLKIRRDGYVANFFPTERGLSECLADAGITTTRPAPAGGPILPIPTDRGSKAAIDAAPPPPLPPRPAAAAPDRKPPPRPPLAAGLPSTFCATNRRRRRLYRRRVAARHGGVQALGAQEPGPRPLPRVPRQRKPPDPRCPLRSRWGWAPRNLAALLRWSRELNPRVSRRFGCCFSY